MAQKLTQTQEQKLQQVQRLSQQQMLQVRLLEMPLTELEENMNAELDDNPALETASRDDFNDDSHANDFDYNGSDDGDGDNGKGEDDFMQRSEREEKESALNDALERMGDGDDELPSASYPTAADGNSADYEEMMYGDTVSFYDKLKEQMGETELTDKQHSIMEYVIGSIDSDGLLRKDNDTIADELAIYHGIDCDTREIEEVIGVLQGFDPPGIGARNLQECLLLQIERKPDSLIKRLMRKVVKDYFEEFTKKHFDRIHSALGTDRDTTAEVIEELRRLNPKPGSALGETEGRNMQQITPDFIVDTDDNGNVSLSLNNGNMPELRVSPSFAELMDTYRNNKTAMSKRDKEALLYAKEKVERAKGYIEAVRVRQRTLTTVMQAIIDWQRKFFEDGDEGDLKPMILKNISEKTGLDISTVSRVSNVKYAQTRWGCFPLRFFFSDGYTTDEGEELSTRKIKLALKDIIDNEDSKRPLSDDAITKRLGEMGLPIARRTVAKYREQLGLPVARLRKH